ncbi:MAG: translation initiation factor eIF-1A [archaeon]
MEEEFKDLTKETTEKTENQEQKVFRVRLPRGKEVLGTIEQRHGGNKMMVSCFDGKTRNCRVPGRLKRTLWLRPNDIVIIEPWELDADARGDIIFKYKPNQIAWLRSHGHLKTEKSEF